MRFKYIANQQAGKYPRGYEMTDPDEIAKMLAGDLKNRFTRCLMDEGEIPHEPAMSDPELPVEAAPAEEHQADSFH